MRQRPLCIGPVGALSCYGENFVGPHSQLTRNASAFVQKKCNGGPECLERFYTALRLLQENRTRKSMFLRQPAIRLGITAADKHWLHFPAAQKRLQSSELSGDVRAESTAGAPIDQQDWLSNKVLRRELVPVDRRELPGDSRTDWRGQFAAGFRRMGVATRHHSACTRAEKIETGPRSAL